MADIFVSIRAGLRSPAAGFLLLFLGLFLAGFYSTHTQDDFQIVKGAEMALLAVTRFIVLGQVTSFFTGLMILGLGTPLTMGLASPLFYHPHQLRLEPFLEMAALGLLPGLGLFFLGYKGFQIHRSGLGATSGPRVLESRFKGWLPRVESACEVSLWLLIATLLAGHWNGFAVLAVGVGSLTLVFSLVVLVGARTSVGWREIGLALILAGVLTILTSILLVTTQGNRCTEAVIGIPPGILVCVVGVGLFLTKKP